MKDQFKADVLAGLKATPKHLSSKYFYDEVGDELFQQIMAMPEYYLTDCEMEIFSEQTAEIIDGFGFDKDTTFDIIELGAGDGSKTLHLLQYLITYEHKFNYLPVDISDHALSVIKQKLVRELPTLSIETMQGEYFSVLERRMTTANPKVVLFIGSNLGNFEDDQAHKFIQSIAAHLNPGDKLLLGLDQIKPADIVLPAYNDAAGITKAFNHNLLTRINRELGGNFDVEKFAHEPEYSETTGYTKSYLKSLKAQQVHITALHEEFSFDEGERIHTETSRKYNHALVTEVIKNTGFEITHQFTDRRSYFVDYLLTLS
jgi:dimethylhistidine N-methyltransferase